MTSSRSFEAIPEEHLYTQQSRYRPVLLFFAAAKGYNAVVESLTAEDSVDPQLRDFNGRTALSYAARNGHEAVVRLLLDSSRVQNDEDVGGALLRAAGSGYEAIVRLLESSTAM